MAAAPTALILGVAGQDGGYLAELLLGKGYVVRGVLREAQPPPDSAAAELVVDPRFAGTFAVSQGDINSTESLTALLAETRPDEIYNLASQSSVRASFDCPELTAEVNAMGVARLLEAIRDVGLDSARYYQASSSEMFGLAQEVPQTEKTQFRPRSPYACSKVYAHWLTVNYREAYGMHASNGILFNHESPRRGLDFVTRKITRAAASIKLGLQDSLALGNLDATRDWGFAGDYVEAMWLMLQQDEPDDYVIATGKTQTVRDFVAAAFERVGLDWEQYVSVDPAFLRATDVDLVVGDATKARERLGWQPRVAFTELVAMMVDADLAELQSGSEG